MTRLSGETFTVETRLPVIKEEGKVVGFGVFNADHRCWIPVEDVTSFSPDDYYQDEDEEWAKVTFEIPIEAREALLGGKDREWVIEDWTGDRIHSLEDREFDDAYNEWAALLLWMEVIGSVSILPMEGEDE